MCAVSIVMDHYHDKWKRWVTPTPPPAIPIPQPIIPIIVPLGQLAPSLLTREEIQEFRELLNRAREYDKKHNQENCELEDKKKRLKDLAKDLGVEIAFL